MDYDQVKKIVESCHLNVLIGSGASSPFLSTLGEVENQLNDLITQPSSDSLTIVEASIKKNYFDVSIEGNLKLSSTEPNKELQETRNNYIKFFKSLHTILAKRETNLVSKQVNIFTTNVDLLMEHALEENQIEYNDGFSGRIKARFNTSNFHNLIHKISPHFDNQAEIPLVNLFKLHGSVNWILSADGKAIEYDYQLTSLKAIANVVFERDELFNTLDALKGKALPKTANHEKFLSEFNKLLIINPTREKFQTTTRDLTFYELLRIYSNQLERENSVLFVVGFSFKDEHVREITKRVAMANPTLLIVIFAFEKSAKESIEGLFGYSYSNIVIVHDETDKVKYSLSEINNQYFNEIAASLKWSIK